MYMRTVPSMRQNYYAFFHKLKLSGTFIGFAQLVFYYNVIKDCTMQHAICRCNSLHPSVRAIYCYAFFASPGSLRLAYSSVFTAQLVYFI